MIGNRLEFSKCCTDGPEFFISGQNYCHDHANHLKDMKGFWRSKASRQAADIHERHTEFMNGKSEASKRGDADHRSVTSDERQCVQVFACGLEFLKPLPELGHLPDNRNTGEDHEWEGDSERGGQVD